MRAAKVAAIAVATTHEVEIPYFLRDKYWMSPTTKPTINPPPTDFATELADPKINLASSPPIGKARNVGVQRISSSVNFMSKILN
jgi:hypothetical protein